MSFLSQTFQAGSSNNTGSVISVVNSTTTPLPNPTGSASFTGGWVSAEKYAVIQVALVSNTTVSLFIEQSFEPSQNGEILPLIYEYTNLGSLQTIYHYVTLPWVKIDIVNTQVGNTYFYLSTKLSLTPPPPSSSTQPISGTVSVDNFPAIQDVSGSVAITNFPAIQDVSGSVAITNFPAIQDVSGSVAITNFPAQQTVYGENSNYEFYATPATNVPSVYADGVQGTNVTGGWKYTNSGSGKINWYCYASSTSATDYKVSQLNSMYAVVNQQSTLGLAQAQNPFIIFYTRMDSGTNNGTWYKNKFFYGENSHTDILGIKLLYTGTDPVGIHPEITGINRIQLGFKPLLSTSTIALSQNESVWLGSLQTTSAPAGQFDFTFQEFGVDWVKTPAILPIEFGAVQAQITTALPTGTNAIGSVSVSNFPATQPVSGTVTVSSITNPLPVGTNAIGSVTVSNFPATQPVSGTVEVSNLITETLATRSVYYLVVGNWYRVATVGITSGAEWNAIGAIVDGESIPVIGRLFKCLQIGTNLGGAGTCYDVEYNNDTTVSGTVKIQDSYGGTIATTAGNLMVGIGNIYTANPLHTIVDSGTVGLTASLNTATYNQVVSFGGNFQGTAYDMGDNSVVDVLLLASGTIATGVIRLDYSTDGTTWFPNNTTTYTISSTDPHLTIIGLRTGSRYIRVSSGLASLFTATNLQMTYSSKRG